MMAYGDIEDYQTQDIMLLNIVTKFHKVVIKITGFRRQDTIKMANFHEQRAITPEGMVRY